MNDQHRLTDVTGSVIGSDGVTIGSIVSYYLDDETGRPNWVRVESHGPADGILPAHDARAQGNDLHVPYTRAQVADAPEVGDADGHLEPEQERELYRHYGLDFDQVRGGGAAGAGAILGEEAGVREPAHRHGTLGDGTLGDEVSRDDVRRDEADIADVESGHNPLRTDRATHDEGMLRAGEEDPGDGEAVLTTRGH